MPLRDDHDDEDTPPERPRWIAWALALCVVLVVLGVMNVGWRTLGAGAPLAPLSVAGADAAPAQSEGLGRVQASDCLRCHGMDRHYVGPSFRQIAGRYSGQPEAADHLARKIREGSVGTWGRVVMPRHPHITEPQALQMAQWLLSLPPAEPESPLGGGSAATPG